MGRQKFCRRQNFKPFSGEAGKRQTSSGAKSDSVPAARRLNAGRLQKSAGNGSFRQMAAMKSPEREFFNRTRLMVHRFFFNFWGKKASFH